MIHYYPNTFLTNHSGILCPRNNWTGMVIFTDSCRYTTINPDNQDDYVKLFGIRKSPLPTNTNKNGAYLTWCYVPNVDKIRIAWYLHDRDRNFIIMPKAIAPLVELNTPVHLDIANYENNFVFQLGEMNINIEKEDYNIDKFKQGWSLQPWGGGTETISHSRKILT
jgi:hypothetical protein